MNNSYKNIIRSQKLRLLLLRFLKFLPDSLMLRAQYKTKIGKKLNLKKPNTFTEKIQWYKLNYRNPLMTQCSDKYNVREYISSKKLEHTLTELLWVGKDPNKIEFDTLPEKFVIKTTNGSGTNIIVTDKSTINEEEIIETLQKWLKRDIYSLGREWSYKHINPVIIIEEYLEDSDTGFHGINDYKFLCMNGKVDFIVLDVNRQIGHKRNIYDANWNYIDVDTDHGTLGDIVSEPEKLSEMKEIAEKLSQDFPFVRVDLYLVNGKIYFGELTFYPWSGYVWFNRNDFDTHLGKNMKLISYK